MQISKPNITSNSLENEYSNSTPIAHRKKYAQFFTPFPIADLMAKWILGNENLKTVLEPAFGLGIFSGFNEKYIIQRRPEDEFVSKLPKIIRQTLEHF